MIWEEVEDNHIVASSADDRLVPIGLPSGVGGAGHTEGKHIWSDLNDRMYTMSTMMWLEESRLPSGSAHTQLLILDGG